MTPGYDTAIWAGRRRPFERAEGVLVRATLADPNADPHRVAALRYALSFARLTFVRQPDGRDLDLRGPLDLHTAAMADLIRPLREGARLRDMLAVADEAAHRTRVARSALLATQPVDRDALEAEITTRQLVVASGGGGGAGYIYPGAYDMLDRIGIEPALMVGTSIGGLMSMFRARRRRFDMAALVAAARALTWEGVFNLFDTRHRYGLPATLRLHLRRALGDLFQIDGRDMRMSDAEIPLYTVATGITVDALKHDLTFYEHLLDTAVQRGAIARGAFQALGILKEFLSRRDALREVVLGRAPGTEDFDVLDAAGFSSAIPAVLHYDVVRDDHRMRALLDDLYATYGITRLGEGGMVSNVPARIAWETAQSGKLRDGRRNTVVLALDCFAPHRSRLHWYPIQQAVRTANVLADLEFADIYIPFYETLSPLNLVPPLADAMEAIRWGREAIRPQLPEISALMKPLDVLHD